MRDNEAESARYSVSCENGHCRTLDATQLEDLICSGKHDCPKCGEALSLDDDLDLECHICSMVHSVSSLEEAMYTMNDSCGACPVDFGESSIHVPQSWQEHVDQYEWMRSGRDVKPLRRQGRSDYWEGLIHFCQVEEFASISSEGRIKVSPTGFYRVRAVCLTEATIGNWAELQSRQGSFGYVFRKRDILKCGGGPAIYIPQRLIEAQKAVGGFADDVKPFINLLRIPSISPHEKKHDFLHEREWRVPGDIEFKKTEPFGVIINWEKVSPNVKGWSNIFGAAMQYEELNEQPDRRTSDE